jgi:LysM repeat protein
MPPVPGELGAQPPPPPVVKPPVVKPHPVETKTYTVAKGDTLSGIAKRYGLTVNEIAALNGIGDPNKLRVGQRLMLPGQVDLEAPRPVTPRLPKPPDASSSSSSVKLSGDTYVVQAGDTLSEIAVRLGVKVKALKDANGLATDRILVGQRLKLPEGAAAMPAAAAGGGTSAASSATAGTLPSAVPDAAPMEEIETVTPEPVETGAAPGVMKIHVVEEGEDVYSVAMLWGISVARLKELNGLTGKDLTPGQRLKVPGALPPEE